jgi:hypothetical protein
MLTQGTAWQGMPCPAIKQDSHSSRDFYNYNFYKQIDALGRAITLESIGRLWPARRLTNSGSQPSKMKSNLADKTEVTQGAGRLTRAEENTHSSAGKDDRTAWLRHKRVL